MPAKSQRFYSTRNAGVTKIQAGVGQFTVSVAFVPNFISVTFHDVKIQYPEHEDFIDWDLTTTATGYDLTVYYTVTTARTIKHVIAKLPVDPEQTISF
jgi:hypothetical protein